MKKQGLLIRMIKRGALYLSLAIFFFGSYYIISIIPSSADNGVSGTLLEKSEPPLRRVGVLEVIPQFLEETILIPGVIEAYEDITLSASIPGIVEKVHVKEGDWAKQDQELFQIDLRSRQARLDQAEANLKLAQKTLERREKVRARGDITAQELDESHFNEMGAAAAVKMLKVEVSLGKIQTPIAGLVDWIDVDAGEYVNEGKPMARLLQLDPVKAVVGVPELYADAVAGEKTAQIIIDALGEEREAVLERVAYGANNNTNTFQADLRLENQNLRLRPGMIIKARMTVKRVSDALLIPMFALVKRETGMLIFVEKDGVVEARPVEIGAIEKDQVEILSGLTPGEYVVVIGQKDLASGERVQVEDRMTKADLRLMNPEIK